MSSTAVAVAVAGTALGAAWGLGRLARRCLTVALTRSITLTDAGAGLPRRREFVVSLVGTDCGWAVVHCGECRGSLFGATPLPPEQAQMEAHLHAWEHEMGAMA